jgi:hypothetical protein
MTLNRSPFLKLAAAVGAVAAGTLFTAGSANAGASWAVGINLPGVAIGVAEPAPVYYPAPVYSAPAPVYYESAPRAYYRPPPAAYYRPAPVYDVQPAPGYWRGERWRHRHHSHRDWDDRGDRDYRY